MTKQEKQEKVRLAYEIEGMSYEQILRKYEWLSKGTLSAWVNKFGWVKSKLNPLITENVNAIIGLKIAEQKVEKNLNKTEQRMVNTIITNRVDSLMRFEKAFDRNQKLADQLLNEKANGDGEFGLRFSDIAAHSAITEKNKKNLIGEAPIFDMIVENNDDDILDIEEVAKIASLARLENMRCEK